MRMVGAMAKVKISKDDEGKAFISDYGADPLVCQLTHEVNSCTVIKYENYNEELAKQNAINEQTSEFSYQFVEDLVEKVLEPNE